VLDAHRAPVVAQIFTWRTVDKLGATTIANRLNADPAAYPSPKPGGWTTGTVYAILRNPKYTGHMVYGRRRSTGRRRFHDVPQDQWIWSPEQTHPAIVTRATWDTAQTIGAEHASARDDAEPSTHPSARRSYLLRSRARCRDCNAACAAPWSAPTQATPGTCTTPARTTWPTPATPPKPPTTPGPSRSAKTTYSPSSANSSPPGSSDPTARPCSPHGSPRRPLRTPPGGNRRRPGCRSGCGKSTPPRPPTPAKSRTSPPCPKAPRRSPRCGPGSSNGSGELETERAQINDRLTALDRATIQRDEPGLLDALPMLGDALAEMPASIQARLFAAFGLELIYNKHDHQVTIYATITPSTPATLAEIIAGSEPPAEPVAVGHPSQHPRM